MESQPQNPEFRINPENFHPCMLQFLTKKKVRFPILWKIRYIVSHSIFYDAST